jgi:protein involved in polysaccharide export with SLBB domain
MGFVSVMNVNRQLVCVSSHFITLPPTRTVILARPSSNYHVAITDALSIRDVGHQSSVRSYKCEIPDHGQIVDS